MDQLPLFEGALVVCEQTDELGAQERSARVTAALMERRRLSWSDLIYLTGLSRSGVYYLMTKVARVLPVVYDREEQMWCLNTQ